MTIRPGVPADLAAILRTERASDTAPHWPEASYLSALSGDGGRQVFVAEDGILLGFAVVAVVAGEAELESVAVLAESRRRGVGRALCGAVIVAVRLAGARAISLEVRARSEEAIALYCSLGFCAAGVRAGYYANPADDALLMRLEL